MGPLCGVQGFGGLKKGKTSMTQSISLLLPLLCSLTVCDDCHLNMSIGKNVDEHSMIFCVVNLHAPYKFVHFFNPYPSVRPVVAKVQGVNYEKKTHLYLGNLQIKSVGERQG